MNRDILAEAIRLAENNGWEPPWSEVPYSGDKVVVLDDGVHWHGWGDSQEIWSVPDIIFSHDFAKALWGEKEVFWPVAGGELYPNWKYHLQCMVVAEDPIKYLGETLDTQKD